MNIGQIFYIKEASEKVLLIKRYYELLNNRRNFLRGKYTENVKKTIKIELDTMAPH